MNVFKLIIVYGHQQNLIMQQIVQQMVVNGYYYIPILKKLQVKINFKEKDRFPPFISFLGYTTKQTCEQASSNQYQYKWARKCTMFVPSKN